MSTTFDIRRWATQAGIQTTGGFAVIAECVTMDELQRFAEIAIASAGGVQALSSAPAEAPSPDVQAKIGSNTWDHFGEILPTLKAISRGDWYWGANSRCKYIEIRIDTRDGGCILYDRERVRISPAQFAHQSHHVGKMQPWPAANQVAASPTPQALSAGPGASRAARAPADSVAAPAIGDELRDALVAVSAAIAERDDRAAQKMIREILAASPTPPAEQQAQPGAVYAELPQPDSWFHFTAQFWENKLRDFADRTHALRMQAAPKAAPGGREQAAQRLRELADIPQNDVTDPFHPRYIEGYKAGHAAGRKRAAPQQEAQEPVAWMWQHEETGRTGFVDCWQIENGFQENNPQLRLVAKLYAAPQPAPAPAPLSDDVVKDAARWRMAALIGKELMLRPDKRTHATAVKAYMDATHSGSDLTGAVDAALAAQGGNK